MRLVASREARGALFPVGQLWIGASVARARDTLLITVC